MQNLQIKIGIMENKFDIVKFVDDDFELDVRADKKMKQCGLRLKKWRYYLMLIEHES